MRLPRASGVLLHLTSLPGPHGAGDLGPSAYHFIDWLVSAGQRLWQVLPLGGIGPGNSPYMSNSAFAGNVLLIDLAELGKRTWLTAEDQIPDDAFADRRVNFSAVIAYRMERLGRAFKRFVAGALQTEHSDFAAFCDLHSSWLDDYALFMSLAESYPGIPWNRWESSLARHDPEAAAAATVRHADRILFWRFCQWCFFRQWTQLRKYANERGVKIVGDVPIFIASQSAEVWARQDLFELDLDGNPTVVAGVPPDRFSDTGQHWGNPLYRWATHAKDDYAWWIARFRHTFDLVDMIRVDHFRGFAAYWEIPAGDSTAERGRWVAAPGDDLFDAVTRTLGAVPIIAEDLGVITPDVVALRKKFDFPGMRILQFAFGDGNANPYLPHNYETDAAVYPGTHDNDTTSGWWANANDEERNHARAYLATDGNEIHWDLIRAACASVADTAIYPMQDILGLSGSHRMNFPGKAEGFWEWRFNWAQVTGEHAQRLKAWCDLYGRT